MIPLKTNLTQIDELPGEEIAFGIGDPRWMMKSAAKLYSDISTAVIREYSTNAYDANIMAGHDRPIRVTLPSILNPFFIVEDEGVGMDIDDFRHIYTQFGTSNKRDLEDANGLMGYGSKCGVAYTTSFEVTSVKNGVKIHGVVLRKPDWELVLKVVATVKTDEPNGTRITVPVHNVDEFVTKAHDFFKFWLPGRVLVDGVEPDHNVGRKIIDGLYMSPQWNTSYVVMSNVAYRINNPSVLFDNSAMSSINFVAYVDSVLGEDGRRQAAVEFTPSREDLEYTDHTKATLQKIVNDFEAKIVDVAKDEIAAATTHREAYDAWKVWTDTLGKRMFSDLEFKGDKFTSEFKVNGHAYQPAGRYSRSNAWGITEWNVESSHKTMFVTGFDVDLVSRHKKMAEYYASQQNWNAFYTVFTSLSADEITTPWIDRTQFVDYTTMRKAFPKTVKTGPSNYNNPNAGRVAGSWDYFTSKTVEREKSIPALKNGGQLFYIDLQVAKNYSPSHILSLINDHDSVVILVPANRHAKFIRENPKVKPFIDYAQTKVVKDGSSLLSDEAKRVLDIRSSTRVWLNRLKAERLDDTELQTLKAAIANENDLMRVYERNLTLARSTSMWYSVSQYQPAKGYNIYSKYPLLEHLNYSGQGHQHVYVYLNAVHAAAESEKK